MAALLLGPILRHVEEGCATIWVETDSPCEATIAGASARTFEIEGHHYAIVVVEGLAPGEPRLYSVELDGEAVWPPPDYPYPQPAIRPLSGGEHARIVFGSCRVSLPHEPPYVYPQEVDKRAHGIDALRTLALRLIRAEERPPDCLLMLGDQIYADDLSPAMREVTASRRDGSSAPLDQLADYDEYALAYREAWSEPLIRWLLSTVPTAMIFDDHEIHAQWKISGPWQRMLEAEDWYSGRIDSGLMAYWVYQHLGNLSPRELGEDELFASILATDGDAGAILREDMHAADRQPAHSRWSYHRDLGDSRLLVIDSRAGRVLDPPDRRMINEGEWEWVTEHAHGDFDHLLLASSLPFFLTPGLHHIEAWNSQLADRGKTRLARQAAEKIRQVGVMDHWAAFPDSFAELCELLEEIATGAIGDPTPPKTIVMLSGDVHHCYLAEVELTGAENVHSRIWQATCSAYRKDLAPREKRAMLLGNSRFGEAAARRLAHMAGAPPAPVEWELLHEPTYQNAVGCLRLAPGSAHVSVETTEGSDWRDPDLRTVFEQDLLEAPAEGRSEARERGLPVAPD